MKTLKKFIIVSLAFIFFNGCQNVKDGLSMKKKNNTDEFLVEKKNPLVLPPDYENLPRPETLVTGKDESIEIDKDFDIEKILGKTSTQNKSNNNTKSKDTSLGVSIMKKIKKN